MTTTTWTISSGPSGNFSAGVEPPEGARGRGHQESVAFLDHALRVARLHVRMPADDVMFIADAADGRHRFHHGRMLVLARVTEVLRQIAFADQHHPDPGHLLQDARKVIDRLHVLAHDDDENLAIGHERPDVSLLVVFLRRDAPVAGCMHGLVAANAFRLVRWRSACTWVATRRDGVIG